MAQRPSYVANYIPQLIQAGHTASSALSFLRENGHSIANQTFYRLWGETQAHLSQSEEFVATPLNRTPSADQIGTATRPRARGYLYNIEIASHDPSTGEVSFHSWGVRSKKLISIGKALQQAVLSWQDAQDKGRNSPPGRALGGFVSSVLNLVGDEDAFAVE